VKPIGALADEQKSESAPIFFEILGCLAQSRSTENSKHEIRNPKQIQMFKKTQNSKQLQYGFGVLKFLRFWVYLTAVCLGFRASNFGFCSLVFWRAKFS